MIFLHRLNGKEFVVNADQIKFLESTPDTVVTLATADEKFMVKESVAEVVSRVVDYKRKCAQGPLASRTEV